MGASMSAVVRSPIASPGILEIVTEIIGWAIVEGIPIRTSPMVGHGVRCISSEGRTLWERDRTQHGCDVVGLAILKMQPLCTELPEAGAIALGVSVAYVEGLIDGVTQAGRSKAWADSVQRHRYLAAMQFGAVLRISLKASRCDVHGAYEINARSCPLCDVAEVGARAARGDC